MSSQALTCVCPIAAAPLSFRRSIASLHTLRLPVPLPLLLTHHLPFQPPLAMKKRSPKRLKYSSQRLYKKDGGEMLYVEIDPSGVDTWKLDPVVELIKDGGVGVIPTDTVYTIVCDVKSHSSIERLRRIKDIDKSKPLSILCHSLRDIDTYTMGFPRGSDHGQTNIFRAVKQCLPGPYTFILPASKALPKQCIRHGNTTTYATRKNVGVRMPDDAICQAILEKLDGPLICTSVKWPKEDQWMIDPVIIADIYEPESCSWSKKMLNSICLKDNVATSMNTSGFDFVVDGGVRVADPSTVVDMTGSTPNIIRQGKGPKYDWMVAKGEESAEQEEELPTPVWRTADSTDYQRW